MRLREALIGIGTLLAGGGIAAALAAAPIYPEFSPILVKGGVGLSFIGFCLLLWGYILKPPQLEAETMGDTYNNNGNNYGHMGPVNIGRQRFEFNDTVRAEILSGLPRDTPINVHIVGSPRSQKVGDQILAFMRDNGFAINQVHHCDNLFPAVEHPLEYSPGWLIIDADK